MSFDSGCGAVAVSRGCEGSAPEACLYTLAVEMTLYPVFVKGRPRREGTGCTAARGPKG